RVRLAARRAADEEGELPVRGRLFGQVVVHAQGVAALVDEVLGHRRPRVRGVVLQGGRVGRRGDDHDRVVHGPEVAELLDHLRDLGLHLTAGDVNADDVLRLLVDDRVDSDGGLADRPVADDQFALAPADRSHGVDGLEPGLQRVLDRLALGDPRGDALHRPGLGGQDRALAVERVAPRVHDATDHRVADGHAEQFAGRPDLVPLLDLQVVAEDDDGDGRLFQVKCQPADLGRGELDHLAGHDGGQAVDAGDAVAHLEDAADLPDVLAGPEVLELIPNN